jgi:stress response protein SCP2
MAGLDLTKGDRLDLTKGNEGLKKIAVALGWDAKSGLFGSNIDVDASVFIVDANEKMVSDGLVYFADRDYNRGTVVHSGDNITGVGAGDDETILIDLTKVPAHVAKFVFAVNIYQCRERGQDFGKIKNAFIRVYDADKGPTAELCRFNLTDNYKGFTGLYPGEVYKHNGDWKFRALGEATTEAGITEMRRRF